MLRTLSIQVKLPLALGLMLLAYFVAFPEDSDTFFLPLQKLLGLSQSIHWGAFLVPTVGLAGWAGVRMMRVYYAAKMQREL